MSAIRRGRCCCNAVVYEIEGEPLFTHACHCLDCQRSSGGAYWITVLFEESQVRISQGALHTFEMTAASGNKKSLHFCPECGTTVLSYAEARPGLVILRPGTLDDTSWVTPRAHIWTKNKHPGVVLPDDVPAFETAYVAADVWPEESLRRIAGPAG
jgi:hypothetical protein